MQEYATDETAIDFYGRIRIPGLKRSYSQGTFIGLPVTERLSTTNFKHTFTQDCLLAFLEFLKYRSLPTISFSLNQCRKSWVLLAITAQPYPRVSSHPPGYMLPAVSDTTTMQRLQVGWQGFSGTLFLLDTFRALQDTKQ